MKTPSPRHVPALTVVGLYLLLLVTWLLLNPREPFDGLWGYRWLTAGGCTALLAGLLSARHRLQPSAVVAFGLALAAAGTALVFALGPITLKEGRFTVVCRAALDAIDPNLYIPHDAASGGGEIDNQCMAKGRQRLRLATIAGGLASLLTGLGLALSGAEGARSDRREERARGAVVAES